MTTHLSTRIVWHDRGWDGHICDHPRGPSRKGLLGNSCVENKGFMVQETAKNLVSGRVSSITLLSSVGPRCMNVSETGSISVI